MRVGSLIMHLEQVLPAVKSAPFLWERVQRSLIFMSLVPKDSG